jgi:3alpha(or 20beta)-hydroxysteroid dehydrogenase
MRLAGKAALITGAAQGIGRATAQRFLEEGAQVMIADLPTSEGAQTAVALGCAFTVLDVGDRSQWQAAWAAAEAAFGGLDILVNNAASARLKPLETTSEEDWRSTHRVSEDSVFFGLQLAAERLRAPGVVVNVGSIVGGVIGGAGNFAYSAAKGAVRAMSRSAAVHFGASRRGIRVNTVLPGTTRTAAVERMIAHFAKAEPGTDAFEAAADKWTAKVALKRLARPEEIANAILFLASEEASFITGAELIVDGGETCW